MKDEISEYYSRARARIKALEAQIKQLEADDWGLPSLSRQCHISTLEKELERARDID
jgi:BMFP domain-containing protein YqiC